MTPKERIAALMERWFIIEPPLFTVLCAHDIVENTKMACPIRTGRKKVEYNPMFVEEMTDLGLEEALKTEAVRILLKHPYERKPDGCCQEAISIGSNIVIGDNYPFKKFKIEKPENYELKKGQAYEWYSRRVQELLPPGGGAGEENGESPFDNSNKEKYTDLSELWEEDELMAQEINGIIERTKNWGSMGGHFAESLIASTRAKINWRSVFAGFRASILSSKRKLTRMKPNRRSGFEQMGSVREFTTRLLVAVDVSGSITSESLAYFYGVINSAFKYGFEEIDVIEFDCGITQVRSLKKKLKEVKSLGRGGTSFDEPIMYAHLNKYDGLVMLTDGYAPEPIIPEGFCCKIIWVCQDQESYDDCEHWMRKSGRVCVIELD